MSDPVPIRTKTQAAGGRTSAPLNIRAKIIKVARNMPPLVKRDRNPDAGWSFVSIDDYYDTAAKALLAEGVLWTCTEVNFSSEAEVLVWKFKFDIFDEEGSVWAGASEVTVPHEYDGPQVTGKVVSYAEKVFLRQLLKLVTGEPDADVSTQRKRVVKRETTNQLSGGQGIPPLETYDELEAALRGAASRGAMDLLIEANKKMVARAKSNDPEVYSKLAKVREEKMQEFESDV